MGVSLEITLGVGLRSRRFAEHVEGIAQMRRAARQRVLDRLAKDEMRAHQPHRLLCGDAQRWKPKPPRDVLSDAMRRGAVLEEPRRKTEREGAGLHEERVAGDL